MTNMTNIVEGLLNLGIRRGDRVLVHSSLSKFGHVDGGANAVIQALLHAIGPEGTLLVPTLTGTAADSPQHPPRFDVRFTPCWTGRIAEALRQWPGAVRSLGPTHSVAAVGPDARRLLAGHEDCRTPCGPGSPYVKLAEGEGKILFLGVTLDANTMFHTAEELAGVPYHLQAEPTRCHIVDEGGRVLERACLLHNWAYPRRFGEMETILAEKGMLKSGRIAAARTLVIESAPMLDFTVNLLQADSWHLVKAEARPRHDRSWTRRLSQLGNYLRGT
jgi:aminoglycoside 3-N-acetyltransferase